MTRGQLLTIPKNAGTPSPAPCLATTVMQASSGLPVGNKVIAEIEYEAITPVMIGDFEGMHYRIIEDIDNGELKAFITGTPTAKAIIGKARWLARVAIATALNLKDHREAERAGIECKGKNKIKSLIGILFGDTKSNGKGIVTIKLEPLASTVINNINRSGNQVPITEYNRLREKISIEKFYNTKNTDDDFFKIDNNKYYAKSPNRFNAFLARPSHDIYKINSTYSIVPTIWDGGRVYVYHIEPIDPYLIKFKLIIIFDVNRLETILRNCNYDSSEIEKNIKKIVKFTILVTSSTPVLLGLGKASLKGFGRFKIINEKYYNNIMLNIKEKLNSLDGTKICIKDLINLIKEELNIKIENNKDDSILIPILKDDSESFCDSQVRFRSIEDIIDKIARASSIKYNKFIDKNNNWVLGLPRRTYLYELNKIRRQSFIIPIIIKNNYNFIILSVLLYSEDLFRYIIHNSLKYKNINNNLFLLLLEDYQQRISSAFDGFCKFFKNK